MTGERTPVIFVSYAHEDADVCQRLQVMLRPLVHKGVVEVWADTDISVSHRWSDEIRSTLDRADVAVLLVSADFLASEYVMDVELPELLERGIPLVCVLVGNCLWRTVEPLASVQWSVGPELPLRTMKGHQQDSALVGVYEAVKNLLISVGAVEEGRPHQSSEPRPASQLRATNPGALLGVPGLPAAYQPRLGDLDALKHLLQETADVGLTGQWRPAGLHGHGGIGKSVLAAALCHDPEVRSWFPEGICWVTLGEGTDLLSAQRQLAHYFAKELKSSNPAEALLELRQIVGGRRCLVVIDDVWSRAAIEAFRVTSEHGRVLFTTRDASILEAVGASVQPVGALDMQASLEYLELITGPLSPATRPIVERLVAQTGGVILALAIVAAMVRAGRSWVETTVELEALGDVFRAHPYADVFKAMSVAVEGLPIQDARHYRSLGVFPEDVAIPDTTVARFWDLDDAGPVLTRLANAGLLNWGSGRVSLHDLQRAFVRFETKEPWSLTHRHLLDTHRPARGWAYLPDDDPYMWDQLLHHLEMAGDLHEMRAVVTNGRWLTRRLHRDGSYTAEIDITRVAAASPRDPAILSLLGTLRRWASFLRRDFGLAGIGAFLVSRFPEMQSDLADLLGPVWLQPESPPPEPPAALLRSLYCHSGIVGAVAFAPDGHTLASAGDDSVVRLWDPTTGAELAALTGHTGAVGALAWSPDGRTLASAGTDTIVRLWNPTTGTALAALGGHTDSVGSLAWSPDGRVLASAGTDGTVRLWDLATGAELAALTGDIDCVGALAWSPDGRTLASAGDDTIVRLWDPTTGAELAALTGHTDWVGALAWSPDGRALASAGADGTVRLWDPTRRDEASMLSGHNGWVGALAWSPDGRTLACAGADTIVRLWDPTNGAELAALTGHTDWVGALAWSPDGRALASAGADGTVRLWDPTRRDEALALSRHGMLDAVAFAPDGASFASGGQDGTVRLWDTGGAELSVLSGHSGLVEAVAFAPDGATLASGGQDGTVRMWHPATGAERANLAGHTDEVRAVAFAPNGLTIASGGADGTIRLWDSSTGAALSVLTGHRSAVRSVAWSPGGHTLAAAGDDGTVRLWDPDGNAELAVLRAHTGTVHTLMFAPDGRTLASGGADGTVRLWNAATGAELAQLLVCEPIRALFWQLDSKTVRVSLGSHVASLSLRSRTNIPNPTVLIASSATGGPLARELAHRLGADSSVLVSDEDTDLWLPEVIRSPEADYVVAIVSIDEDLSGEARTQARDSLLFQLGLAAGSIGNDRAMIVVVGDLRLPSDLAGIQIAPVPRHDDDSVIDRLANTIREILNRTSHLAQDRPPSSNALSVFLSYARADLQFVRRLFRDLRAAGLSCWLDVESLAIGSAWPQRVQEAAKMADRVLLVLSNESVRSSWVGREVTLARERERETSQPVLFPIRIDDSVFEATPPWITQIVASREIGDFTRWTDDRQYEQSLRRLIQDLTISTALPHGAYK